MKWLVVLAPAAPTSCKWMQNCGRRATFPLPMQEKIKDSVVDFAGVVLIINKRLDWSTEHRVHFCFSPCRKRSLLVPFPLKPVKKLQNFFVYLMVTCNFCWIILKMFVWLQIQQKRGTYSTLKGIFIFYFLNKYYRMNGVAETLNYEFYLGFI